MLKKLLITALVMTAVMPIAPGFCQSEITNNQPVKGVLNKDAERIQQKLKDAFNKGLIDADQNAELQRDLDGILTREDDLKSRGNGMNDAGKKDIAKQFAQFEARLDKQTNMTKGKKTK